MEEAIGSLNLAPYIGFATVILVVAAQLGVIVRVLLRPHRQPASRIAWVVVIGTLPVLGVLTYLLFGEVNIGRRRIERMRAVLHDMPPSAEVVDNDRDHLRPGLPPEYLHVFELGRSISQFEAVGGNGACVLQDSDAAIDALVADIDAATDHVHLLFYIWLADGNGLKVTAALERAASRGVTCRAMADDLGSRALIRSKHWQSMQAAGVRTGVALPIGNPLLRPLTGRIDLRNHRKIVVIDGHITYCGSQNCADPEFRIKAKYAPWVDIMVRLEGPVAAQNQRLFASDWMTYTAEDLDDLLKRPVAAPRAGIACQVIGTGPTVRYSAMPEMFECLMHAARDELVVTTPYFVPDESMQNALCTSAYRGVDTTIVFPARNDSWIVAAASRSYYRDLLIAGVKVFEYTGGLLHAKTLTLDGRMTLIGSANLDRRSFELNYENNILCCDEGLTGEVRQRQEQYLAGSRRVLLDEVNAWPPHRRLWNNTVAMLGPLL